ncbi:AbiTii domain-containing protein [Glutamicibacter sp. AOP38-B1-38]|uniref:AbiTii domain-containing protein n=1 Tax=Glutamicibacter sp. AOP38-B1-38 TaxID=3457680 RepID=UPI0040343D84
MTTTLLQSLRERILDESESLAGLLRKCLALGVETKSNALRDWARNELHGYGNDDDLPEYRKLRSPPIKMDSMSGNYSTTGQIITRLQVPPKPREFIAEKFIIQQPVEELEELAKEKSLSFSSEGLSYAQSLWNSNLNPFQQIINMSYTMNGSAITGILSKIRTQLMELIMDLTSDTPLTDLPRKDRVDQAVSQHIGTQYVTTIHS